MATQNLPVMTSEMFSNLHTKLVTLNLPSQECLCTIERQLIEFVPYCDYKFYGIHGNNLFYSKVLD